MEKSKQRAVDPDDYKQHSPNGNLFKKFRKFYEFPAGGAFFFELLLILPAIRVSIRRDEHPRSQKTHPALGGACADRPKADHGNAPDHGGRLHEDVHVDPAGRCGQDRGATSRKAGHPDQVREKACP